MVNGEEIEMVKILKLTVFLALIAGLSGAAVAGKCENGGRKASS